MAEHNPLHDSKIRALLGDPDHGTWRKEGKVGVYTPSPSFFAEIRPMQLAKFFHEYGGEHYRLNLP
jgi:hypothetical protein